ncbi:DUF5309 family protein [Brevibacillus laterosporus]|nr:MULTISPECIES: DUF5309 family protein [Bacillales]MCR8937638.1 DUF5309 domain-containing protein [Brevibacillus laterosporus]MCR8997844.1 DUF5309 domain-containing protein [Brevibacillus laterosporus]MCZ0840277.1 DUF5309 family protein [Brevibacillus laterosporus]MCZ0853129.1 DUF5309 family protein [Brevibacillus laterosporus]RUR59076.1 hypothetical protein ELS81_30345 [Bacillus sp. VKPM B-3276]
MSIYSMDLIGKKESVVDEILLLNPNQTPMLNLLGFSNPVISTTHVWYEDEVFATKANVTTAADAAATTLVVSDIEPFRDGLIVQVNEEMLLVQSIELTTKSLTVVRGYGGTTAAAIAKNSQIEVMFVEGTEGARARDPRYKSRAKVENITQIFDDSIEVSGTAQSLAQYGIGDQYGYEKAKKELELALQLEKAIINGLYFDNGKVRQMRGIRNYIQSNVITADSAITTALLNDTAQKIYTLGGFSSGGRYAFVVPAKQKRAISELAGDKLRLTQAETARGQVVDHIVNDFGSFPVIMNDNLKSDEILLIDTNRIAIRPLADRSFSHTLLGVTGDRQQGMIVGEYTLEFRQEKAHARVRGLK